MRVLDLCCGVGGAGAGYRNIGLHVVGVDVVVQKNYPYEFCQANVLELLPKLIAGESLAVGTRLEQLLSTKPLKLYTLDDFDFIHASPPCKAHTVANNIHGANHDDIIEPLRELLIQTRKPYVIENVIGAPLVDPIVVCGLALGLKVKRHRKFESNIRLFGHKCDIHYGPWITIFGRAVRRAGMEIGFQAGKEAMGVTWCTSREELSQSIPPKYTEFVGRQVVASLTV